MTFKLVKRDRLKAKVKFELLGDLGKTTKHQLTATFSKLDFDEFKQLQEEINQDSAVDIIDIMGRYILDIEDVEDEAGPVKFSDDLVESLMQEPAIRVAFINKFAEIHSVNYGQSEQRKN